MRTLVMASLSDFFCAALRLWRVRTTLGAPLRFFSVISHFEHAINQQEGGKLPFFLLDGEIKKRYLHIVDIIL